MFRPSSTKLNSIELVACEEMDISKDQLRNGGRSREFSHPRQLVWAVANLCLGYSLMRLSRSYKNDHTTILHGVRRVKKTEELARFVVKVNEKFPGLLPESSVLLITKRLK